MTGREPNAENAILRFEGHYAFLSNFHREPDGTYVEREFQREKCLDPKDRRRFEHLTPGKCKRLGQHIRLRPDWEEVKVGIMERLVRQKFLDHPSLAAELLLTGHRCLIEGNYWGDSFWGVTEYGHGKGHNQLGIILMKVRDELREPREGRQ